MRFSDLVNHYDAFLLDAYGVFWGSNEVGMLPGSAEAMQALISMGKQVGILSNSTQLSAMEKTKLSKRGVFEGVHYHFFLTSGQILRDLLERETLPFPTPKKSYWLFSSLHPLYPTQQTLFEGLSYKQAKTLEGADFIYLSIPHIDGVNQEDPELFRPLVQAIENKNIPVVCANPDAFAPAGKPPKLVVRQGAIAKTFIEEGFNVHFIGKPERIAYEKAHSKFRAPLKPSQVLMVGDTPETDIRGAMQFGMPTALVTETGIMAERLKNMQSLDELARADQPNFFIKRFKLD